MTQLSDVMDLVRQIHECRISSCIAVTGVGTQAVAWLFAVPGASRTILDVQVPYSAASLYQYIGKETPQHVSSEVAMLMAESARARALTLPRAGRPRPDDRFIGLACTGAVATDRIRRGEDRAVVAWTDGKETATCTLSFNKSLRNRASEERDSSLLIVNCLAEACGIERRIPIELLQGERIARN